MKKQATFGKDKSPTSQQNLKRLAIDFYKTKIYLTQIL